MGMARDRPRSPAGVECIAIGAVYSLDRAGDLPAAPYAWATHFESVPPTLRSKIIAVVSPRLERPDIYGWGGGDLDQGGRQGDIASGIHVEKHGDILVDDYPVSLHNRNAGQRYGVRRAVDRGLLHEYGGNRREGRGGAETKPITAAAVRRPSLPQE